MATGVRDIHCFAPRWDQADGDHRNGGSGTIDRNRNCGQRTRLFMWSDQVDGYSANRYRRMIYPITIGARLCFL